MITKITVKELKNLIKESVEKQMNEKWQEKVEVSKKEKGKYKNWTLTDLRKERNRLKSKEERTEAESSKLKEINFAIRAKTEWGKIEEKEKPSAGLTKKQKSTVVKKAKSGKDIGEKGKTFKDIETKAKEYGAKDPKAVAASAMWKNIKR